MRNRKTLLTDSGFSLVQVDEVGEKGNILSTSYEVLNSDGNVLKTFEFLNEAQNFIKTVLPPTQEIKKITKITNRRR